MRTALVLVLVLAFLLTCGAAHAQFSGTLQGVVLDPSGAGVVGAKVTLTNPATNVVEVTTTDAGGNYRFLSLAPSHYQLRVAANGFAESTVELDLMTAQLLVLPVNLVLSSQATSVTVSSTAPILDTGDSRSQLTLNTGSSVPFLFLAVILSTLSP